MTKSELQSIVKGISGPIHDLITRAIEPVKARNAALEARVVALESKPYVKFCGTWERSKTYEPGNAVVRDGGLWICKAGTSGEPSKDFAGWQLAVRRGSV